MCGKRVWVRRNRPIKKLVSSLEVTLSHVVDAKIKKNACVLGIERRGFFEIGVGFSPFALTSLNGGDSRVGISFIWQVTLCDLKLGESPLVVAITIII